jgi:ribosome maturation factor RimP
MYDEFINKRVKVLCKDGVDEHGNPRLKAYRGVFLNWDNNNLLLELDNKDKIAISWDEIVKVRMEGEEPNDRRSY